MTSSFRKHRTLWLAVTLWVGVLACVICLLESYENAPGRAAAAPPAWPTDSQLTLAQDKLTLVLFAHPACPCTRATLRELERLSARMGNRVDVTVVFSQPENAPAAWDDSDLLSTARSIPGVHCRVDLNRVEALRFGVQTSGQLLAYTPDGQLQFAGGITTARGHEGDSPGAQHVLALAGPNQEVCNGAMGTCSVYGCPLFEGAASDGRAAALK